MHSPKHSKEYGGVFLDKALPWKFPQSSGTSPVSKEVMWVHGDSGRTLYSHRFSSSKRTFLGIVYNSALLKGLAKCVAKIIQRLQGRRAHGKDSPGDFFFFLIP